MDKYIVELKKNETLYKAATRESDGTAYVCSAIGTPYTAPDLEQIRKEAYEQGRKDGKIEGQAETWVCARKICDMKWKERGEVFGTDVYADIIALPVSECIEKIRQYEQGKEGRITKGDVVRMKSTPEVEILVTYADEEYVSGIAPTEVDGNCEIGDQYTNIRISNVEKTGKHYDIVSVLQKMREESNG